ncbi:MAG: N-acetyltransferase [Treponema sp.]|nr:N-acetyltransferase [Treponema sp.]
MDFIKEDNRIYATGEDGNVVAEVTFPVKDGIATIDHTFVADSLRGQGIAGKLMEEAVAKIQADGNKIAATCSYAVSWLGKHPEVQHIDMDAPIACKLGGRH